MLSSRREDIQALARLITYRFADYIQRASALITCQAPFGGLDKKSATAVADFFVVTLRIGSPVEKPPHFEVSVVRNGSFIDMAISSVHRTILFDEQVSSFILLIFRLSCQMFLSLYLNRGSILNGVL